MIINFNEIFFPSEEQKKKNESFLLKIKEEALNERHCSTCAHCDKNFGEGLPGFVTVYPKCMLKDCLALETCLFYELDKE